MKKKNTAKVLLKNFAIDSGLQGKFLYLKASRHVFSKHRVEEQNRHIAFCLSQLNFSERSIKKLQENLPCYQGLLSDVELFDLFINIIGKAKKCVKAENKVTHFMQTVLLDVCFFVW